MKKTYLFILALFMLNTIAFSQVTVTDWHGNDLTSTTFNLPLINIGESGAHFTVTNTGTEELSYKLKVLEYVSPDDAIGLSVCANGNCVFLNSEPQYIGGTVTLTAGDSYGEEGGENEIAYAGFVHNGSTGQASLTMQIVDAGTDAVLAEFTMDTSVAGMNDITESVKLSVYPNPSNGQVTFSYDKSFSNGQVVIKNIIGKSVAEINLRGNSTTSFSTTNLPSGIYLYSLISEGEVIGTKKMVVK